MATGERVRAPLAVGCSRMGVVAASAESPPACPDPICSRSSTTNRTLASRDRVSTAEADLHRLSDRALLSEPVSMADRFQMRTSVQPDGKPACDGTTSAVAMTDGVTHHHCVLQLVLNDLRWVIHAMHRYSLQVRLQEWQSGN